MHTKLCSDLEQASHAIATAFIQKMYDVKPAEMDEIHFISNDPTGTLLYGDYFWSLHAMYETLLNNYNTKDVWNWYYYSIGHSGDNRETYINLWHFVRKYPSYTGDLVDIAKQEKEEREAITRYWNSEEGKVETERNMEALTAEFLKTINHEKTK
jgi:hypothetical protein